MNPAAASTVRPKWRELSQEKQDRLALLLRPLAIELARIRQRKARESMRDGGGRAA